MRVCPSCGEENPEKARFCLACATPLEAAQPQREERKTVSVLFVDLVGFTSASERADPEDVRAVLGVYHARLKQEIERFGGTVEKFIGDAVMAVFGAPVAHEDDPERAVRAGLRVLEAIEELREEGVELSVRAAVNTGEALVSLAARPERGEALVTGDVVNTAARLQSAAPVGGLVVGELTMRATHQTVAYEQLDPVVAKGKSEPIPLWRALEARSRFGVDVEAGHRTPLVGRQREFALLRDAYGRAVQEAAPQFVTITGEPGIGKSRLVSELSLFVDNEPELVFWRQGRCLPYGEGITFWALGEIVKAHAGVLESDDLAATAEKLEVALEPLAADATEKAWLSSRLGALVGADADAAPVEREESFAAWSRFLETIAARGPFVLVVEDLHWADSALLDFLEHLGEWISDVPLLTICTARPELYERAPAWGGGKRNATTIALLPLSTDETSRLVTALLEQHAVPAEVVQAVLERSGGNPLYAEEFIRMLEDRGLLRREGRALSLAPGAEIPLPENVTALVAARLDTLSPDRKALLQDAAVLGKVFWSGSLQAMGEREARSVSDDLRELARKDLVRRSRTSSVAGESEYAFWHTLIRDVAYSQIPRGTRARRHVAAARWIEEMAGERLKDHAELLVHHYGEALSLSRAASQPLEADVEASLRRALVLAGERALALDYGRADDFFQRALELTPLDDRQRPQLLLKNAETAELAGRSEEATRLCGEAEQTYRALGDRRGQARALNQQAKVAHHAGRLSEAAKALAAVVALLEGEPATPELVTAFTLQAFLHTFRSEFVAAIDLAERAAAFAWELGLRWEEARARAVRGMASCWNGDVQGIDDIEAALETFEELNESEQLAVWRVNLAEARWTVSGPARGLEECEASIQIAERRGAAHEAAWARAESLRLLFELGRWDETLQLAGEVDNWARRRNVGSILTMALTHALAVQILRDGRADMPVSLAELLDCTRSVDDDQLLVPALVVSAYAHLRECRPDAAALLLERTATLSTYYRMHHVAEAARVAVGSGRLDLADAYLRGLEPRLPRHQIAVLAARASIREARGDPRGAVGDYAEAAESWMRYGFLLEHGHALLGHGRCLVATGRSEEANASLVAARDQFGGLGAHRLVAEVDSLLPTAEVSVRSAS